MVVDDRPVVSVRRRPRAGGGPGFACAVSGVCAAALVVLAVLVVAVKIFGRGWAGPSWGVVLVHVVAAAVAVVAQVFADRTPGRVRAGGVLGVLVLTLAVLGLYWWF